MTTTTTTTPTMAAMTATCDSRGWLWQHSQQEQEQEQWQADRWTGSVGGACVNTLARFAIYLSVCPKGGGFVGLALAGGGNGGNGQVGSSSTAGQMER
ncbi:GH16007 [Drosophila grimshawi]|uniref:GH16007 n=1 Tax=Drosophila grimshawi TaxID=7222 RepID=B4J2E9_DROGR|nr:GH16007 [Drosophila grimshawi]